MCYNGLLDDHILKPRPRLIRALPLSLVRFPSLVNCTTIDWFSEWPADALKSVASRFLHDVEMTDDRTRAEVEDMCMVFHQSVRQLADEFRR
jgi:dynein heavy chain